MVKRRRYEPPRPDIRAARTMFNVREIVRFRRDDHDLRKFIRHYGSCGFRISEVVSPEQEADVRTKHRYDPEKNLDMGKQYVKLERIQTRKPLVDSRGVTRIFEATWLERVVPRSAARGRQK